MSSHDNEAAERIRALLDRIPDSTHATVEKPDLRAVLAENKTMRLTLQRLAEELEELPAICRNLVGPRCGEAYDRAREAHRLVGEWQPAGPAQDEQAAKPACAPTPNGLICACGKAMGHDRPTADDTDNNDSEEG